MSNLPKLNRNPYHHEHRWEKSEHRLPDGFKYHYSICKTCHLVRFPGLELQKIQDYSKEHLFISVEDWALLLLYAGHEYIAGITHYQKILFLVFYELAPKQNIPTENPGFYGYKYGPYSDRIDEAIDFLIQQKYIGARGGRKSSSKEQFYITPKGKKKGRMLFNKLSEEQKKVLKEFRKHWDQKTTKSLCKYIYSKPEYKKFLDKSVILDNLFPGRKLYRRRG